MTPADARSLHDRITAADGWVIWFVIGDAPDRFIGRAMVVDLDGGRREGGDLLAGTIDELRAMLPLGLTRWDRTMMMAWRSLIFDTTTAQNLAWVTRRGRLVLFRGIVGKLLIYRAGVAKN